MLGALFVLCASAASAGRDERAGSTVEVVSQNAVTVVGRFESLWGLVEDLCEKSGVSLRTYTAPDRAVVANYEKTPLRNVFERLLSRESFVLGVAKGSGTERARIKWVRVFSSRASEAAAGGAVLPRAAFASPQPAVRRRVASGFAFRLRRNAEFRSQFLRAGGRRLLRQLEGSPYAAEFLRELSRYVSDDRRLRAKVSFLLEELETSRRAGLHRAPYATAR